MSRVGPGHAERHATGDGGWIDRLLMIDRRIIFVGVVLAVVIPLLKPVGLPIRISQESQDFYDALAEVSSGETIVFSFDYEADTRAELDPMSIAVWRYCFSRDIRVIALTNYAGGPGIAAAIYDEAAEEYGKVYGEDYVFLGYNPDWQATMLQMGESIRQTFPTDQMATPTDEIPVMAGIDSYADVPLLVTIAASALGEYWAIFGGGQYQQKVITGGTAIQAILLYPYYNTGQITGFLGGLRGAAEYEKLTGMPGAATPGMDAQSAAHVLIVFFILLGNVAYIVKKRQIKAEER